MRHGCGRQDDSGIRWRVPYLLHLQVVHVVRLRVRVSHVVHQADVVVTRLVHRLATQTLHGEPPQYCRLHIYVCAVVSSIKDSCHQSYPTNNNNNNSPRGTNVMGMQMACYLMLPQCAKTHLTSVSAVIQTHDLVPCSIASSWLRRSTRR